MFGDSLRRAPFVWYGITLLALAVILRTELGVTSDVHRSQDWFAWAAAGFIAYDVLVVFVLWPRVVVPRAHVKPSVERAAALSWTFGVVPVLVGGSAAMASGRAWIAIVGFGVSAVLLVLAVRDIRQRDADS